MFCPKCGNNNDNNAAFCQKCGAPIELAAANNANTIHKNKSNKAIILIIIGIVSVILLSLVFYLNMLLNSPNIKDTLIGKYELIDDSHSFVFEFNADGTCTLSNDFEKTPRKGKYKKIEEEYEISLMDGLGYRVFYYAKADLLSLTITESKREYYDFTDKQFKRIV